MFLRSRLRIATGFTVSMGTILVLFAAAVYAREVTSQRDSFDRMLQRQARQIALELEYRLEQGQWQVEQMRPPMVDPKSIEDVTYIRWYDSSQRLVQYAPAGKPRQPTQLHLGFQTVTADSAIAAHAHHLESSSGNPLWLRQVTVPVVQNEMRLGYLQIAVPLTPLQTRLEHTRLWLALGVPITLGLIGWVGWLLSGLAMQPTRQSYEQLQRFTADASHELRAPLAAILSNAQVGMLASSTADRQQRLGNIATSAKNMSQLITNLLFLARQDGQLALQDFKPAAIADLVKPLSTDYKRLATQQNLNFRVEGPAQPISIRADGELLQQALRNLLDNAFKYTPSEGSVTLQWRQQGRLAIIEIMDTGIGIPAADLPHIFERFYRVDEARARETGGFGLGLSIAQQIVQAHGGQLMAKSTPKEGSQFCVELPI